MTPRRSWNQATIEMDRAALERRICSLTLSLTAAWGYAQLLERRARRGAPVDPGQAERATGVIASACAEMNRTIRELEESIDGGEVSDAADG